MPLMILLCLAVWSVQMAAADTPKLRFVADRDFPPLAFTDGGMAKGLWVDLAKAVADRLGQPYSIEVEDWRKAQADVQGGSADVLYGVSITEERANAYELSLPVFRSAFTFFTKGKTSLKTLEDLGGLAVGVTAGGVPAQLLGARPGVFVTTFETYEDAFTALSDGKVDVFAANRWVGTYFLSRGRWADITAPLGNFASLGSGFAVRKGNTVLRDHINDVVLKLTEDGTFDKIIWSWAGRQSVVYLTNEQILLAVSVTLVVLLALLGLWNALLLRERRHRTEAENLSRTLEVSLEQAGWGVAIGNRDGTAPVYVNKEFAEMHGYEASDLIGHPWGQLLDEDYRTQAMETVRLTFEKGTYSTEQVRLRKDGTKFPAIVTATSLLDGNGCRNGIMVNLLDITERKNAEAELVRTQKLESIAVLSAGIAHDFNNILAGLNGQIELATMFLDSNEMGKARERMRKLPALVGRAKALTSRLVSFAKGGNQIHTLVDLGNSLEDWVTLATVGSDVVPMVEIAHDLWNCVCDKNQIGQVIHNLVLNARQASPSGGIISVRAENAEVNGSFVAISVTDHGTGIAPADLDRLFDPFFTTKATGSGLGLSVSFSIAKQHSGWIDVDSEVGKGSTFTVHLPASKEELKPQAAANSCVELRFSGVAVVMDDMADIRDAMGDLLGQYGFEVLLASNGREALKCGKTVSAAGKRVELYVLDLTIPGDLGGMEVAEELKKAGSEASILFMSGYSDEIRRLASELFESSGWLSKPFTKDELSDALCSLKNLHPVE